MAAFVFLGPSLWRCSALPRSCEHTNPQTKRMVQTSYDIFKVCSRRAWTKRGSVSVTNSRKWSRNMGLVMTAARIEMDEGGPFDGNVDAESTTETQDMGGDMDERVGERRDMESDAEESESREARGNEQERPRSGDNQKESDEQDQDDDEDEDGGCSRAEQEERTRQKQQADSKPNKPNPDGNDSKAVPKPEEKNAAAAPSRSRTEEYSINSRSPRRGPGMSLRASSPLGALDLWAPLLPFPFSGCWGSSPWRSGPYCSLDKVEFPVASSSMSSYTDLWDCFSHRSPEMNLHEDPSRKEYTLVIEAPGFDKDAVEVFVKNRTIYVRGGWNDEHGTESFRGRHRLSRSRRFSRSFKMSDDVDIDKIKASVNNGIIYVHMPRESLDHDDESDDWGRKIDIQQD